jgi:STE24 endopeptidase
LDPRIAGVARTFRILDTGYCLNEDKSTRYHRLRRRADLIGTAVAGVLLLALLLSGGAHRLRELAAAIARWAPGGMAEAMTVVVMTIVLMIILQIVEFPFAFYQGYLLEHRYGLSTQSPSHWMTDQAKGVALGLVLAVAGTSVIYLALRESPDHWWWISAAVFALATIGLARIAPVVLLPIFYTFKPLDRPALVDRLMALANRARTDVVGVFEWVLSGHTRKANAALAGMGRTRRILLSDTLLADYSEDEIEVILAHELAHHVHRDLWRGIAVQSGIMAGGFFVASLILRAVAGPLALGGVSDPAGLPVLMLAGGVWSFLALPLANAMSRAQERAADRYALATTRNVDAFVTAMKRLSQQNLAEEYPSPVVRWLFYSHPPIRERIDAARAFAREGSHAA